MAPSIKQSKASESKSQVGKSTIHIFPGGSTLTDSHRTDDTLSRAPPAPVIRNTTCQRLLCRFSGEALINKIHAVERLFKLWPDAIFT